MTRPVPPPLAQRRTIQPFLPWSLGLIMMALAGCTTAAAPQASAPQAQAPPELKAITLDSSVAIVAGQTVYVPIYSHIYMMEKDRSINLTGTLSIRNTDMSQPLILTAVDYYDSSGSLVRRHLEQPVELGPMAATEFVVPQDDPTGGAGASFLVEWVAPTEVSSPVMESIMINTGGNQGLSFISPGRVIQSRPL